MARVLVIEDEEVLRESIVRGLGKLEGLDVVGAASLGEALQRIDEAAPDVVLSDLDLPDRSGIELLGELGRRGLRCPLTFVSAYTRAFSAQIPPHSRVRVREKPVSLDDLREIVLGDLARARGTAPPPFGVAEYAQLACLGRHSVAIRVGTDRSTPRGRIVVHEGRIWSARDEQGEGLEAFRRMAFATGTPVTCTALREDPGPPNLEGSWEGLLLEAARVTDESHHDERDIDDAFFDLATEPEPTPTPEDDFETTFDNGVAALLARDLARAWTSFTEAERRRPGDRRVHANLERLRALGFGRAAEESHD